MEAMALMIARVAVNLFAGAAVYISIAEQPARMRMRSSAAIDQFRGSLPRAERMQPALLLLALSASCASYALTPRTALLVGSVVLALIVPLSLALLVPINRRLLGGAASDHVEHGMRLIGRWGELHALRAMLALAGSIALHV